jgi:predicted CDP-diglyceride synthetase/phosphatidate cytidylyltransferase
MLFWVLAFCSTPFLNLLNVFYMYVVYFNTIEQLLSGTVDRKRKIAATVTKGNNNTVKAERDVIAIGQQIIKNIY